MAMAEPTGRHRDNIRVIIFKQLNIAISYKTMLPSQDHLVGMAGVTQGVWTHSDRSDNLELSIKLNFEQKKRQKMFLGPVSNKAEATVHQATGDSQQFVRVRTGVCQRENL